MHFSILKIHGVLTVYKYISIKMLIKWTWISKSLLIIWYNFVQVYKLIYINFTTLPNINQLYIIKEILKLRPYLQNQFPKFQPCHRNR